MNEFLKTVKNERNEINEEMRNAQKKMYKTYSPPKTLDILICVNREEIEKQLEKELKNEV
jgi:hypothetical protein